MGRENVKCRMHFFAISGAKCDPKTQNMNEFGVRIAKTPRK
jgi:hypothetical protein